MAGKTHQQIKSEYRQRINKDQRNYPHIEVDGKNGGSSTTSAVGQSRAETGFKGLHVTPLDLAAAETDLAASRTAPKG